MTRYAEEMFGVPRSAPRRSITISLPEEDEDNPDAWARAIQDAFDVLRMAGVLGQVED